MSAAKWRSAMNSSASGAARPVAAGRPAPSRPAPSRSGPHLAPPVQATPTSWWARITRAIQPHHIVVLVALLVYPFVASPFFTFQVGAQSLALGLVALSLTFLGGYGGMVSLAQLTVAGIAGYSMAILGTSGTALSLGWPWWVVIPFSLSIATLCSVFIGWLSVRTEGIYTIMITLAIGVAFYYLALQNYTVFNGFQGFQRVYPPTVFDINWRAPMPFYFLTLALAVAGYFLVKYVARAPFGIALQGIRDNPRRMAALGYHVVAHRVAAYAFSGFIAAVGGVLLVWYNGLIVPGSVGTAWLINILVIAVIGGMKHPIGPFLGAIVFVLLQTFAVDLIDRERFNLVIGGGFLAIVLFSPDGLIGLWARLRARLQRAETATTSVR